MVKIEKGRSVRLVSEGAFKNYYQRAGWKTVDADPESSANAPAGAMNSNDDDSELLALREKGKQLKIPRAAQMGKEKLLSAIAVREERLNDGLPPASTDDEELSDEELLEIPAGEMTEEELERAAGIVGFDYKANSLSIEQFREKLPELLAAR